MWGKVHSFRNNLWYSSGWVSDSNAVFSIVTGFYYDRVPFYIEWLNSAELKHTNYEKYHKRTQSYTPSGSGYCPGCKLWHTRCVCD